MRTIKQCLKLFGMLCVVAMLASCGGDGGGSSSVDAGDGDGDTPGYVQILPRTVYVNIDNASTENAVAAFSMDSDGTLVELAGSPFLTGQVSSSFGGDASSITVHRATKRLFATNLSTVAVFDIDDTDGSLTAITGSPFSTGGSRAFGIVVNEAGTRVFVANGSSNDISVLDVAVDGTLTPVAGSPFAATSASYVDTPQLLNNESVLAVTDEGGHMYVYLVDAATGALTDVTGSPFTTGAYAWSSRANSDGSLLYIPDTVNRTIQVYSFDAATGVPAQITGSPFASGATSGALNGFAFTPDGNNLYVGNNNLNELLVFSLAADGTPTALAGSPVVVTGAGSVTSLAVTGDNEILVTTDDSGNTISVFALDADGTPVPVVGSPFAATSIGSATGLAIGD